MTFQLYVNFHINCTVSVLGADAEVVKPPAHGVFYVFGSEGITIVDPEDRRVVSTILPDVVCTKSAR